MQCRFLSRPFALASREGHRGPGYRSHTEAFVSGALGPTETERLFHSRAVP